LVVALRLSSSALAQEIRIGERSVVARTAAGWALVEPHLAVHPRNAGRLLAVAIHTPFSGSYEAKGNGQTCRVMSSVDAGKTWQSRDLSPTWCFDPWLAFTTTDEAVLALIGRHPAIDSLGPESGLLLYHSGDGGQSWPEHPIVLRRDPDHPTIATDTTGSAWRGSVYVMSGQSIQVVRSRDGGRTFAPPIRMTPNNLINLAEKPAVLSDGSLVLSFVDAGRRRDSANAIGFFPHRRSWLVRSVDGGETFGNPSFVTDTCGPPPRFQQSFLAVDPSPAFRDRLYFACRRAGGGPIVVARSADRGARWSEPVPVSAESADTSVSRVMAIAVNARGVLAVAWIVGRPAVPCHEVWVTGSIDGGQSFLLPRQISAPRCSSAAWSTSGDYFGLAASPSGEFHLLWGEPDGAEGVLVHTTVEIRPSGG
jgi:hypothetical protein